VGLLALVAASSLLWLLTRRAPPPRPEPTKRQLTANPPEDYVMTAAISPDGRHIAYSDQNGLYLRSVASGETHAVSLPAGFNNLLSFGLKWFPDGEKLLAVVNKPDPYALWVIRLLGEAQPQLLYQNAVLPAISPDGQSITFMSCCMERPWQEILVGGINGEAPRKLVAGQNRETDAAQLENGVRSSAWSPDGRWIAYLRTWKTAPGQQRSSIEVRPSNGGPAKTLLTEASLPKANAICIVDAPDPSPCMAWSPDWCLVFAASQAAEPPSAGTKGSLWQVRVKPSTGEAASKPEQLTPWSEFEPRDLTITQDGKRLSFVERNNWNDVYLAELGPGGNSIKPPRRLTLDNRGIFTLDSWTPDRRAIVFSSSRNGRAELFRKGLKENIDEVIVRGPESYRWARLTADGSQMLYVEWTANAAGAPTTPDRLMRRPVAGGPPDRILEEPAGASVLQDLGLYVWDYKCPLRPGIPCVLGEKKGNELDFYSLDPLQGKGKHLGKTEVWRFMNWDVSPDGSRLALIGQRGDKHLGKIEVLTLSDSTWQEISPERGVGLLMLIAWTADGKGFFVNSWENNSSDLVHITLSGKVETLIHNGTRQYMDKLLPSPDGKYLAYQGDTTESNVWMLEGF
jgi:Tol biopolymer transport system component